MRTGCCPPHFFPPWKAVSCRTVPVLGVRHFCCRFSASAQGLLTAQVPARGRRGHWVAPKVMLRCALVTAHGQDMAVWPCKGLIWKPGMESFHLGKQVMASAPKPSPCPSQGGPGSQTGQEEPHGHLSHGPSLRAFPGAHGSLWTALRMLKSGRWEIGTAAACQADGITGAGGAPNPASVRRAPAPHRDSVGSRTETSGDLEASECRGLHE